MSIVHLQSFSRLFIDFLFSYIFLNIFSQVEDNRDNISSSSSSAIGVTRHRSITWRLRMATFWRCIASRETGRVEWILKVKFYSIVQNNKCSSLFFNEKLHLQTSAVICRSFLNQEILINCFHVSMNCAQWFTAANVAEVTRTCSSCSSCSSCRNPSPTAGCRGGRPVLLQHGLILSSRDFLTMRRNESLSGLLIFYTFLHTTPEYSSGWWRRVCET